jgi:hypothetical protein
VFKGERSHVQALLVIGNTKAKAAKKEPRAKDPSKVQALVG